MRFRSYDALRIFDVVARHLSFTAAAEELNRTKGAISYQIARLERDLGFPLFVRGGRGIALTEKGKRVWHASQSAFGDLDRAISEMRDENDEQITIGLSTYFASRWLSPRLMNFLGAHREIGLRLQPLIDPIELRPARVDMAIRWGKGDWRDMVIEPLLARAAFPTAGPATARRIAEAQLSTTLPNLTLLHDRDGSRAWLDWHEAAGLAYHPTRDGLVIPDPNVRVQAVVDEQGLALNDELAAPELLDGRLVRVSTVALESYGYFLAYPEGALRSRALRSFRDWIASEAVHG